MALKLPQITAATVMFAAIATTSRAETDQFAISCDFKSIPRVIMTYTRPDIEILGAMTVGGRGPAVMTLGAGSTRFESADIDGFQFRWSPANQIMDVDKDAKTIRSEKGECSQVPFGNETPLHIR